jgi:glutathione S-transferase
MQAGEHKTDAFAAINPFAKVPAFVDQTLRAPGGEPLQLFESGAILLHLADHHANEFTGTADQVAAQRALATQWVLFPIAPWLSPCLCRPTGRGNFRN